MWYRRAKRAQALLIWLLQATGIITLTTMDYSAITMYQLYIGNKNYSSWSLRPWVLMRALSISFEERLVNFEGSSNWNRFRAFSPSGRVPCLHDDTTVVWDSLAIIEYLAERHAGVWPEKADVRAWARSVVGEMHSQFGVLRERCPMNCGLRVELNAPGETLRADIARIDEIWTQGRIQFGGPYLAGTNFTAADAFFAPVVFRVQSFGLPLGEEARTYAELMLSHAAMREWYREALSEPWRDTSHEKEVAATGTVQSDYRQAPATDR